MRLMVIAAMTAMLAACTGEVETTGQPAEAAASAPTREDVLAHGKYIVDGVGLCNDCHTPRLPPDGSLDMSRQMAGAPNDTTHNSPMPWATVAPALAGLPAGYTEAGLAKFLMDGTPEDGSPPLPPMPPYRMNAEDAAATAAYIASLPKPPV